MDSTLKLSSEDCNFLTDPSLYRRLIGRLIYLTITRPDLSYSVQILGQFMSKPAQGLILDTLRLPPAEGYFFPAIQTCNSKHTVTAIGRDALTLDAASLALPFSLVNP